MRTCSHEMAISAEVTMGKRLQRSSGSATTLRDLLRTWRRRPREATSAADIAAIDRGEGRTVFCYYRGLYGSYPRRFAGCMLDLTPDGPVIRPMLFLRFLRQRIPVSERVLRAQIRPFENQREAFQLGSTGQFAAGGLLDQSGSVVISCETVGGVLEFAVRRPDVDLVMHFFDREAKQAYRAVPAEDA
jgi:hypothetical protein